MEFFICKKIYHGTLTKPLNLSQIYAEKIIRIKFFNNKIGSNEFINVKGLFKVIIESFYHKFFYLETTLNHSTLNQTDLCTI